MMMLQGIIRGLGLSAAVAIVSWGMVAPSYATMIGDSVNCDVQPNTVFWGCSSTSATVVDPGVEFQLLLSGTPRFDVDIDGSSINMTFVNQFGLEFGAGEVLTLSDLDWVNDPTGEITGFSLLTSGVTGLVASDITTSAHSVVIDFDKTMWSPGDSATITLQTSDLPEPSTMLLLATGLVGLIGLRYWNGGTA